MMAPLLNYLNTISHISEELEDDLTNYASPKEYATGEAILKPGKMANHACFVVSGLVRSYYLKDNGDEVTTKFLAENSIITSIFSFYGRKPGNEFIVTLEPTSLLCFHYDDIQQLYKKHVEFNSTMRIVTERYLYFLEVEVHNLRKQKAEDRLLFFEKHFGGLLQRVPQKYIASYLGITTETLSRIRGRNR